MKKKQLTYLLLPVVIGIWGYIFYKFFNDTNLPTTNYEMVDQRPFVAYKDSTEYTFKLIKKYRDPFLSQSYSKPSNYKNRNSSKIPVSVKLLPSLVYFGIVTSKQNDKKIGLLMIDGQNHMAQKNETINGIKIIDLNDKSMTIQFDKITKTLEKKN